MTADATCPPGHRPRVACVGAWECTLTCPKAGRTTFDSHLSGTVGRFGGGLTARLTQSLYLCGEYDIPTGDHFHEPWAFSAGREMATVKRIHPRRWIKITKE